MFRQSKRFALGLIGVMVIAALSASSASAALFHSGSTSGNTYLTMVNEDPPQFDLQNGANVKCTTLIYDGAYAGTTASALNLTPTYAGCLSSGQQTTVNTNGCTFTLTTPTQTTDTDNYHDVDHLNCPAGKSIVASVGDPVVSCTVTMDPQTLGGVIDWTDITGSPKDVTLRRTLSIVYTASGSVCGANGTAKLTGAMTAKAYGDAAHTTQVDLWIH